MEVIEIKKNQMPTWSISNKWKAKGIIMQSGSILSDQTSIIAQKYPKILITLLHKNIPDDLF
jgi:hypothetical protein